MRSAVLFLLLAFPIPAIAQDGALAAYIQKDDGAFRWEKKATRPGAGFTAHFINLHSLRWLTPADVDRVEWRHWLTVVVPDEVKHDKALMLVQHRNNTDQVPEEIDAIATTIALATNSVVAGIGQVPNQPLVFAADPEAQKRTEDDLIAFAQARFLKNQDPEWLPRFPMVKATVRAMDAVQEFMAGEGGHPINDFVVAGASKRGWTTWLTGAMDKRVRGIIPIVIDVLNIIPSMDHHKAAYGDWSFALAPYIDHGIMEQIHTPEFRALLKYVDPYEYRRALTMPKYVLNATGDELFLPDSSQFYFPEMPPEKHLRYVPNSNHYVDETDSVLAMYHLLLLNKRRPELTWSVGENGSLQAKTDTAPAQVRLWHARNPDARDFRIGSIGEAWASEDVATEASGVYAISLPRASEGWTAGFLEFQYELGVSVPFTVTTEVVVLGPVTPPSPPGGT